MKSPESPLEQNRNAANLSAAGTPLNANTHTSSNTTEVRLSDGRVLRLPTALLTEYEQASSSTGASGISAAGSGAIGGTARNVATTADEDSNIIPLIEERLQVGKRTVSTGTVRLRKSVQEFETALHEPLAVRTYDIERIVLNQPIDTAPDVRHEGDTTIYPLVEERLILTKQLILKEEVRVTKRDTERIDTQTVTLRREHLEVEREGQ